MVSFADHLAPFPNSMWGDWTGSKLTVNRSAGVTAEMNLMENVYCTTLPSVASCNSVNDCCNVAKDQCAQAVMVYSQQSGQFID